MLSQLVEHAIKLTQLTHLTSLFPPWFWTVCDRIWTRSWLTCCTLCDIIGFKQQMWMPREWVSVEDVEGGKDSWCRGLLLFFCFPNSNVFPNSIFKLKTLARWSLKHHLMESSARKPRCARVAKWWRVSFFQDSCYSTKMYKASCHPHWLFQYHMHPMGSGICGSGRSLCNIPVLPGSLQLQRFGHLCWPVPSWQLLHWQPKEDESVTEPRWGDFTQHFCDRWPAVIWRFLKVFSSCTKVRSTWWVLYCSGSWFAKALETFHVCSSSSGSPAACKMLKRSKE